MTENTPREFTGTKFKLKNSQNKKVNSKVKEFTSSNFTKGGRKFKVQSSQSSQMYEGHDGRRFVTSTVVIKFNCKFTKLHKVHKLTQVQELAKFTKSKISRKRHKVHENGTKFTSSIRFTKLHKVHKLE